MNEKIRTIFAYIGVGALCMLVGAVGASLLTSRYYRTRLEQSPDLERAISELERTLADKQQQLDDTQRQFEERFADNAEYIAAITERLSDDITTIEDARGAVTALRTCLQGLRDYSRYLSSDNCDTGSNNDSTMSTDIGDNR